PFLAPPLPGFGFAGGAPVPVSSSGWSSSGWSTFDLPASLRATALTQAPWSGPGGQVCAASDTTAPWFAGRRSPSGGSGATPSSLSAAFSTSSASSPTAPSSPTSAATVVSVVSQPSSLANPPSDDVVSVAHVPMGEVV